MEFHDYYKTLGVPRTATQADIKKAFRKLARENHPDKKPGDEAAEARFKAVNEANAVLADPDKRKKYDRLGKDWEAYSRAGVDPDAAGSPFGARGPFGGFGGAGGGGRAGNVRYEFRTSSGAGGDFSDFFRTFFTGDAGAAGTGSAGTRTARRGAGAGPSFDDILAEMGLRNAAAGAKMVVIPKKNEKDIRDIPEEIRKQIKIVLAESMDQVLETALRRRPKPLPAAPKTPAKDGSREESADAPIRRPNFPPDQPTVVV